MDNEGPSNLHDHGSDPPNNTIPSIVASDDVSSEDEFAPLLSDDFTAEDLAIALNGATLESQYAIIGFSLYLLEQYDKNDPVRRRYHDCPFTGPMRVRYYLDGNKQVDVLSKTRMSPNAFLRFCEIMRGKGLLADTQYMTVHEQVFIFFGVASHVTTVTELADTWQHSGETISRYFGHVLRAICALKEDYIRPPNYNVIQNKIQQEGYKFLPWFADCVGAIDGTYIPCCPPRKRQRAYRNRHGYLSHNVLAVVNFDETFTYILSGWEGSAHDAKVLRDAIENRGFEPPPMGKFYLVDSGYANTEGFLAPYRGTTYHIDEFGNRRGGLRRREDVFNYTHSSLRTTVERAFSHFKERFKILKYPNKYSIDKQAILPVACAVVHNYLIQQGEPFRLQVGNENGEEGANPSSSRRGRHTQHEGDDEVPHEIEATIPQDARTRMARFRDDIANQMWARFCVRPWYRR